MGNIPEHPPAQDVVGWHRSSEERHDLRVCCDVGLAGSPAARPTAAAHLHRVDEVLLRGHAAPVVIL